MTASSPHAITVNWRRGIWGVFIAILCLSGLLDMVQVLQFPALTKPLPPADPDSWLRMTLVKQWMNGGGFFNHLVANTNAPIGGISSHWTRPLDFVLAALASLMPAATLNMKILLTACWYPVLLSLAVAAALSKAADKIFRHNHTLVCVLFLMIASPFMPDYFKPGESDHHGMMSLLWCMTTILLLDKTIPRCRAFLAGALLGVIIWMSPEGLLLLAAALGMLGFEALAARDNDNSKITTVLFAAIGTAVVASIGLFVEIPAAQVMARLTYDSLSIVHVVFLWLIVAGTAFLRFMWPCSHTLAKKLYTVATGGVAVILSMAALYPRFFLGPFADADPYVFTDFLPVVQEAHPLFSHIGITLSRTLMEPALAILLLVAAFKGARPLRPERRLKLLKLSFLFAFTLAMSMYQERFLYYIEPIAIIICAALLPVISIGGRKFRFAPRRWQPYLWLLLAFVLTTGPIFAPLVLAQTKPATNTAAIDDTCLQEMRYVIQTQQLQKLLGDKNLILYTFEDTGGEALYFTPYRIIASNYHREAVGLRDMRDIREAVRIDDLKRLLKKRQVDAMLFCPVYHTDKQVLHGIAESKNRPSWLAPVTALKFFKNGGYKPVLLRVKK